MQVGPSGGRGAGAGAGGTTLAGSLSVSDGYGCEHLRMRKALTAVLHWLIRTEVCPTVDGLACDIQEAAVVSNTESVTW